MKSSIAAACVIAGIQLFAGAAFAESPEAAQAQKQLEPYRKLPTFQPPGEAFDAAVCMKGKSILSLPASSAVPFIKTIQASMSKVAKEIGFNLKIWENQGQPTQWVQGFDYAINNKFNLIDLLAGADPRFLEPQVKAAEAAGLKVVASHLTGYEQPLPGGVTGVVPIDYKRAGALLADWAIWKTDGKVNAIIVGINDVLSTDSMMSGVKEEFAKCPNCKSTYVNVTIPDMATKTQTNVQAALTADPTVNYVIPIYDVLTQWVVPAVTITGRTDKVKVATFNGTPFAIGMVQEGKIEVDIGENLDWIGHAVVDSEMRMLCGLPTVKDPKIPLLIFDKSNADTAGKPPQVNTGYGDAYIEGYRKLWRLH
ncbi:MAG TPA: sugar ABC transporter substrate-binding protein [Roseiarcus sp.]|nr:sugar ABC transporter substrate-binding protein [Roseiarcus sp.]